MVNFLLNMAVLFSFHTLIRKQPNSLLLSSINSENAIVKSFVESDRFFQSSSLQVLLCFSLFVITLIVVDCLGLKPVNKTCMYAVCM